jgi:hypothetical protein
MKNLNPIYLLEVETKTILHAAKKVRNALVKGGMSKEDATTKVLKRLNKMRNRSERMMYYNQLPKAYKDAIEKTPQWKRATENISNIMKVAYSDLKK